MRCTIIVATSWCPNHVVCRHFEEMHISVRLARDDPSSLFRYTLLHRLAVCYLLSWCRIQFHRIESSIFYFLSTRAYDYVYTRTYTRVTAPPHAKDKRASSKHVRTHTSPHTISHKTKHMRASFFLQSKNQKSESRAHSLSVVP